MHSTERVTLLVPLCPETEGAKSHGRSPQNRQDARCLCGDMQQTEAMTQVLVIYPLTGSLIANRASWTVL